MRDPKRIWQFLSKLAELWELKPVTASGSCCRVSRWTVTRSFWKRLRSEAILDKEIAEAKAWQKEQQKIYKL